MSNRKRGAWVNFNDSHRRGMSVVIHPGSISTSATFFGDRQPVLTNGKIGSISDIVTIEPQTAQADRERGQE
jgi:hypothetical protein